MPSLRQPLADRSVSLVVPQNYRARPERRAGRRADPGNPAGYAGFACAAVLALAGMRTGSWRNARRALC